MGGGGGGGGGLDKTQKAINEITLARLEKEEAKTIADEEERQRLLAAGRFGRTSLLTGGFTGPGQVVKTSRGQIRANERAGTRRSNEGVRGPGSALSSSDLRQGNRGNRGIHAIAAKLVKKKQSGPAIPDLRSPIDMALGR